MQSDFRFNSRNLRLDSKNFQMKGLILLHRLSKPKTVHGD